MKGLLHSKRFKKNLTKWILMYIGVIGLLTTVITYSKYMTTLHGESDTARVAKFAIDIRDDKCSNVVTKYCNYDTYRLTDEIEYYFTVDATGLEVITKVYLTFTINSNFEIVKNEITEIDPTTLEERTILLENNSGSTGLNYVKTVKEGIDNFGPGGNTKKIYKIVLKYNGSDYASSYPYDENRPIVQLDYSAIQQKA